MAAAPERWPSAGRIPVVASAEHAVLSPAAAAGADLWDEAHVRLPCSPQSLYPVRQPDGSSKLVQRWSMVQNALLAEMRTSADLENAIKSYNSRYQDKWNFKGLRYFIDEVLGDEERDHLFESTLPQLARLALRLPELLTQPLPMLTRHKTRSVTLSQMQIASLLANAFFCTFPRRNAAKRGDKTAEYSMYPDINFNRLFLGGSVRGGGVSPLRLEKYKCLLHYFHRVLKQEPRGRVTFSRRYLTPGQLPRWEAADLPLRGVTCHSDQLIEDQAGMLQVDFANKFVGGGVLGDGCVQEEIRFLINPELLVSRLFTEALDQTECLVITGSERFSHYDGYSDTFRWVSKAVDRSPADEYGRRSTEIVAIDAVSFRQASKQYEEKFLLRELNKAYVGFFSEYSGALTPVATGNWGCGAFNGDPKFKALLQMMAAAVARRDLVYLTFGDDSLRDELRRAHELLKDKRVTVGKLYSCLLAYGRIHGSRASRPDLFQFLAGQLGADDYGSDTDLEREDWSQELDVPDSAAAAAAAESSTKEDGLADVPQGDSSPNMSQELPPDIVQDAAGSQNMSQEIDEVSDMETADSQVCVDPDPETAQDRPASQACADPDPETAEDRPANGAATQEAAACLGADQVAGDPACLPPARGWQQPAAAAGAKRVRRADREAVSTAEQFARFEVISETARQRPAARQTKITSFLRK